MNLKVGDGPKYMATNKNIKKTSEIINNGNAADVLYSQTLPKFGNYSFGLRIIKSKGSRVGLGVHLDYKSVKSVNVSYYMSGFINNDGNLETKQIPL